MSFRIRRGRGSFSLGPRGPRASYRLGCLVPVALTSALLIAAGCTGPPGVPAVAPSACEAAVAAAAAFDDNSDTIEQLDPALRACSSLAELKAASVKYPSAFDGVDPVIFATNRCASSSAPAGAAICALVK
jgi:hypothetical protein